MPFWHSVGGEGGCFCFIEDNISWNTKSVEKFPASVQGYFPDFFKNVITTNIVTAF